MKIIGNIQVLITFSCSVLSVVPAMAQPCNESELASIPGKFKPGIPGSVKNVTAANLAKEKQVLAGIHKMISSGYQPAGCEITYSNAFGYNPANGKNWVADPYYYGMFILKYTCGTSKRNNLPYQPSVSSNTNVFININYLWSQKGRISLYAAGLPDNEANRYFYLKSWPQQKDGFFYWMLDDARESVNRREYQYLVTYNGKLPFRKLTRKEFLPNKIRELNEGLQEYKSIIKTINPNFDAASKRNHDNMKETIAAQESLIKNLEDMLRTQSAEELNKPAIIGPGDSKFEFSGFKNEGEPFTSILAVPDMSYYKPGLPRWVPQFICITVGVDTKNEVYKSNIAQIEKALDFNKLNQMLGNSNIR